MRLALVIALTADRRNGCVISRAALSADEAIAFVKDAISADHSPDPRYPILQAIALDSVLREHRFKPTDEEVATFVPTHSKTESPEMVLVTIGDGDERMDLRFFTQEEADFMNELIENAKGQNDEINKLRETLSDRYAEFQKVKGEAAAMKERMADVQAELKQAMEAKAKLEIDVSAWQKTESDLKESHSMIETLRAELAAAQTSHPKKGKSSA